MYQSNAGIHGPGYPGQPPQYNQNDLPQVMRPTNVRVKTGENITPMYPIYDAMGRPIPIQHGTMDNNANDPIIGPPIMPVIVGRQMGPHATSLTCQSCREAVVTRIQPKSTMKTLMFAIMFGVLCLWPCVAAVYCTKTCKNLDHYCPNCNSYIGSYVR